LSVLLGWTLFGRVVLPRLLGLWLLAVSLLIGFAELVLGMRFGVRLLRLVRGVVGRVLAHVFIILSMSSGFTLVVPFSIIALRSQ
jgi:vacuolar-type H+-ATPase subunit I/STV1